MPPPLRPLTDSLLARLGDEEQLVHEAAAVLGRAHAALRAGDPPALAASQAEQVDIAVRLQAAAGPRAVAAGRLAAAVGLPADQITLSALIALLPDPEAAALRAAQARLAAAAAALADIQRRNANLAHHLRSYFRGVFAALTAPDGPARYGPAGTMLPPAGGAALQARG